MSSLVSIIGAATATVFSIMAIPAQPCLNIASFDFTSDSQTGVSGTHDPFSSFAPSHATRALRRAIGFEVNWRVKRARFEEKAREADLYAFVGLWGLLQTMTLEEQRWFKTHVWKLGDCETTENANQVLRAPSRISRLNGFGDPLDRELFDILKTGHDRRREPYRTIDSNPNLNALERKEALWRLKLRRYDALVAVSSTRVTESRDPLGVDAFLAKVDMTDYAKDVAQIRRRFSPAQVAEWDMILQRVKDALDRIDRGQSPWDGDKPPEVIARQVGMR